MGMKNRLTALILAASITVNMVTLPVKAEEDTAPIGTTDIVSTLPDEALDGQQDMTTAAADETTETVEDQDYGEEGTDSADETGEPQETEEDTETDTTPAEETGTTEPSGEETIPSESIPEETAPSESVPGETVPSETTESETEPTETVLEGEESELSSADDSEESPDGAGLTLTPADLKGLTSSLDRGTEVTINNDEDLATLAEVNPEIYQVCTLSVVNTGQFFETSATFPGLGNAQYPFAGTLTAQGDVLNFQLEQPLFDCLADSAVISGTLHLKYIGVNPNVHPDALLARQVIHREGTGTWDVTLQSDSEREVPFTPPLIDTIGENCEISLKLTDLAGLRVEGNDALGLVCCSLAKNSSLTLTGLQVNNNTITIDSKTSGNAGGLVGEMGEGAVLALLVEETALSIVTKAEAGNAGGLVGVMGAGAQLRITNNMNLAATVVSSSGAAGGIVATMGDGAKLQGAGTIAVSGTVSASGDTGGICGNAQNVTIQNPLSVSAMEIAGDNAGGLIGSYFYSEDGALSSVTAPNMTNNTVSGGSSAGGVFGALKTVGSREFAITSASFSVTLKSRSGDICLAGGLIGSYDADNLDAVLNLDSPNVTISSDSGNFGAYGGLIGNVGVKDGPENYVQINEPTITISGGASKDAGCMGGLIGGLSDSYHMVKTTGSVNVTMQFPKRNTTLGGLVGSMPNGVLWMDGTVDMSGLTKDGSDVYEKHGWILGWRNNTLVVANETSWTPKGGNANDIGNWGQVLPVGTGSQLTGLVTPAGHAVTINTATVSEGSYTISSPLDYAKVALRLQLDPGATLVIPEDARGAIKVKFENDIVLNGLGLTGLQRDCGIDYKNRYDVEIVGTKPEANENDPSYSITFPGIQIYSKGSSHNRQGLITLANDLTVTDLTLTGKVNVSGNGCTYYIGALAAEVAKDIKITGVSSTVNITCTDGNDNSVVGGLIGYKNFSGNDGLHTAQITNCTWKSMISVNAYSSGIYVGGLVARADNQGNLNNDKSAKATLDLTFRDCTISGTLNRTGLEKNPTTDKASDARVGGLIGSVYMRGTKLSPADGEWGHCLLTIDGVTVDGVTITTDARRECGGLLSYEWLYTDAVVTNLTVKNNSRLKTECSFGGLVYKASGYCSVRATPAKEEGGSATPGITIQDSSFTGKSSEIEPSSLLICHADAKVKDDSLPLYLEILYGAYKISSGVNVTLTEGSYIDEIAGSSMGDWGNGIVSIETENNALINQSERNTYKNQLTLPHTSPRTRYYYNLNAFGAAGNAPCNAPCNKDLGRKGVPKNNIDDAEKMVLFSAYSHCDEKLNGYFYSNPGEITGSGINLAGYSYYPAEEFKNVTGAEITFDFEGMNGKETGNKLFTDRTLQHYGMHVGLFVGQSGQNTLKVKDLTLKGTVGVVGGISGALVWGDVCGTDAGNVASLDISGVTLDGIRVCAQPTAPGSTSGSESGTEADTETGTETGNDNETGTDTGSGTGTVDVAHTATPLLIESLGSFTNLKLSGVVTTEAYVTENIPYAATSLIGNVGSPTATEIMLTFSDMALDGRDDGNSDVGYGTNHSIFTHASFLESFRYTNASTCRAVYNFTVADNYTLGKELSVSGRNQGRQYWFSESEYTDQDLVCLSVGGSVGEENTFFASGYLPYVCYPESGVFHEIDVNLKPAEMEGCGTYSHPYIITDYTQLQNVMEVIRDGGVREGWKLPMDPAVLGNTFSSQSCSGSPIACVEYTCSGNNWTPKTGSVVGKDKVLAYLCNAYFKIVGIDGVIEMGSEWAGLGTSANPFSGVIAGSSGVQVVFNGLSPSAQFGGLIKFSYGSVVKGLEVVYNNQPEVTTSKNENVPSDLEASFFGGVVGWCLGGDTIIEDVTVTYNTNAVPGFSSSADNPYLSAVGGYVGMVGGRREDGYAGGVVFRGRIGEIASGDFAKTNYFYYNPYVGRVLDGYAMLENTDSSETLDNTDNNYQIPTISPGKHLVCEDGTVTVNDAQGLWLLSAIANSGAACMDYTSNTSNLKLNNNKAYTFGKPRTGTYNDIGGTLTGKDETDEQFLGGTPSLDRSTCYLIDHFASGDFHNLTDTPVTIVFKDGAGTFDMSGYGNGFRGIGTSYGTNTADTYNYRLLQVSGVTGNSNTVILNQNRNEYIQEKDNWTSIGTGLFVLLRIPGSVDFEAENLNFAGTTGITYYDGTTEAEDDDIKQKSNSSNPIGVFQTGERLSLVGSGMFAGNFANNGTIQSISLTAITYSGTEDEPGTVNPVGVATTHAGGIIGMLWNGTINGITKTTLTDCTANHVAVNGRLNAGGLIGTGGQYNQNNKSVLNISYENGVHMQDVSVVSTQKTPYAPANTYEQYAGGVGGLVGMAVGKVNINGIENSDGTISASDDWLTMEDLTVKNSVTATGADKCHAGGLVGLWVQTAGIAQLHTIALKGKIEIVGGAGTTPDTSIGGLVGAITGRLWKWTDEANIGMNMTNIRIAADKDSEGNNSQLTVRYGRQIGGLIGMSIMKNATTYDAITIGGDNGTVRIANEAAVNAQQAAAMVGCCLNPAATTIENVQITNTTVISPGYVNNDERGIGLIAGDVEQTANITIRNLTLRNSNVVTFGVTPNKFCAGLVYGIVKNNSATSPFNLNGSNILAENCIVGIALKADGTTYLPTECKEIALTFEPSADTVGLQFKINGQTVYKRYSDLSGEKSETNTYDPVKIGLFGGEASGTKTTKLVGVSIQQRKDDQGNIINTLPLKEFGGTNTNSCYVIRADYLGNQDGTGTYGGSLPFVTTSPVSTLTNLPTKEVGKTITLTGDGASFVQNPPANPSDEFVAEAVANRILKEASTNVLTYDSSLANVTINNAPVSLVDNKQASFVDFATDSGNPGLDKQHFPVLALSCNRDSEANALIYAWISLLTNKSITKDEKNVNFSIDLLHYQWSNGSWIVSEEKPENMPLMISGKHFMLNRGSYDSCQERFTLIDVKFYDPADASKVAYHLYIPVIIQKMVEFRFWATAQPGTSYIRTSYDFDDVSQAELAAVSHGEQVTVLMTYEYQRTKTEWEESIANGDNLLFGFNKTIRFDGGGLPVGTRLTLVDCTKGSKAYYAKGSNLKGAGTDWSLSFADFKESLSQNATAEGSAGTESNPIASWAATDLCELLQLHAAVADTGGLYYQVDATPNNATLRAIGPDGKYHYYQYYSSEDEGPKPNGDAYSISITWTGADDQLLREQYYLTIQTPDTSSGIRNNLIWIGGSLGARSLPTMLVKNPGNGDKYSRWSNENRFLIGDFFKQTVNLEVTEGNGTIEMSSANHIIEAVLTSNITFTKPADAAVFKSFLKGRSIFHSFELEMRDNSVSNPPERINLVPGTRVTAEFFLDGESKGERTTVIQSATPGYRLDFPGEGIDVSNWSDTHGAQISVNLTLEYPDEALLDQFPEINGEQENVGVNLGTNSYLAYTKKALATTTLQEEDWDEDTYFIRKEFKTASLNYYAVDDSAGSVIENTNQLGVNGWDSAYRRILSAASYDVSALSIAGSADQIQCTLNLYQKNNSGGYDPVSWGTYLHSGAFPTVQVTYYNGSATNATPVDPSDTDGVVTFSVENLDKGIPIEIKVDMEVLTGGDFERDGLKYANYKVVLITELKKNGIFISGSRAEDHIIYTNARINPNPKR